MEPNTFTSQPANPTPASPVSQPITPTYESVHAPKKVGPIVAVLIVALVLVIAALYIFASRLNNPPVPTDISPVATTQTNNAATEAQQPATQPVTPVTNAADDVQSLSNDLNAATQGLDSQNF